MRKFSGDPHPKLMRRALALAAKTADAGEVPIAALLVKDGKVIAKAGNKTKTWRDPTAHAEIIVIQKAIRKIQNERFTGTVLYCTLEPCAMCAGAVVQARIPTVVYGARDLRAGACGSVFKVLPNRKLNHRPFVVKGVLAEESVALLQRFFRRRREEKKSVRINL